MSDAVTNFQSSKDPHSTSVSANPSESFSGIGYFLKISFPLIISQTTDNIMLFMDRIFLSSYGALHGQGSMYLNASLIGALTLFFSVGFFLATAGYTNALVAQYFGAKRYDDCSKVAFQGIILALLFYPVIVLISQTYQPIFELFGHHESQLQLELSYTRVLILGSFLITLRSAITGFFSGLGKTKIVMISHLIGMSLNIPLNYLLIFGKFGLPELGILGAAWATIISFFLMDIILLGIYFSKKYHKKFHTRSNIKWVWKRASMILKYGSPAGIEFTLGIGVFTFFMFAMNGYGPNVGAAATIAINWDSMFFIPMLGASFATTTIVGQHLGARQIHGAINTLKLSMILMTTYAVIITAALLIFTRPLIDIFFDKSLPDYQVIFPLAKILLQLVSLYLIFDGIHLSLTGLLKGAGDTKAVMFVLITLHLSFGMIILFFIFSKRVNPIESWFLFIGFVVSITLGLYLRYRTGAWKRINLVNSHD